MDKDQFRAAFIKYCMDGGHSFDNWDIASAWTDYQKNPSNFGYLNPFKEKE